MSGDEQYRHGHRADRERDEILGAALRRLAVPAHRAGFHADLRAKLSAAVPERAAADQERPTWPTRARMRRGRARHPRGWTLGLAAAAAVALALVLVTASLPGTSPGTATAAQVRAAVASAWAS